MKHRLRYIVEDFFSFRFGKGIVGEKVAAPWDKAQFYFIFLIKDINLVSVIILK